jgi:hypothetical protein
VYSVAGDNCTAYHVTHDLQSVGDKDRLAKPHPANHVLVLLCSNACTATIHIPTDGHGTCSLKCTALPQSGRLSKGYGTAPFASSTIVPERRPTTITYKLLHLGTF